MQVDKPERSFTFTPPFSDMSTTEQKQQTPTPAELLERSHARRIQDGGYPDPDTLSLQSIAASLIEITKALERIDSRSPYAPFPQEPKRGWTKLDSQPDDQAQSAQTGTGAPTDRSSER